MGDGRGARVRWAAVGAAGYSAGLTALIAGPLLGPGYLLLRDAVSTPRSYPTDSALGLGDAAPRAVPQDALLAALSPIVDGGLLVKAILLLALWAAGYGAAVLVRELLRAPLAPQLVAVTVALWNPYVAERLLQGHWSLLTGYAALPWTALAAYRLRTGTGTGRVSAMRIAPPPSAGSTYLSWRGARSGADPAGSGADRAESGADRAESGAGPTDSGVGPAGSGTGPAESGTDRAESGVGRAESGAYRAARVGAWGAMAACLAAAGLTPTGALLAGCVALVTVSRRDILGTLLLWAAASAPWLAATALSGAATEPSDPAGIAAFAARAEPGLGTLGSLAGLGGIWNGDAVPASRTTPVALLATVVLLVLIALGVRAVSAATDKPRANTSATNVCRANTSTTNLGAVTAATDNAHANASNTGIAHANASDSDARAALRIRRALLALALPAVLLPALAATGWGMPVMEWLVVHIPGAGLLRDTQKYVALAVPAYTLCAAAGCQWIAARLGGRTAREPRGTDAERATGYVSAEVSGHTDHTDAVTPKGTHGAAALRTAEATTSGSAETATSETSGTTRAVSSSTAEPTTSATAVTATSETSAITRAVSSGTAEPTTSDVGDTAVRRSIAIVAALCIAFLILPLLDLAWGVGGALRPVHYPIGWQRVAERVDGPGDVAVLPGGMFRRFPYSGKVAVLDPAPRMLPDDVLQTGELPVRGTVVAGEGKRARAAESSLLRGDSPRMLADIGVGWVLVERTTPGPLGDSAKTLAALEPVYEDAHLALYRVPDPADRNTGSRADRSIAAAAHVLWIALLIGGSLTAALSVRGRTDRKNCR